MTLTFQGHIVERSSTVRIEMLVGRFCTLIFKRYAFLEVIFTVKVAEKFYSFLGVGWGNGILPTKHYMDGLCQ